MTDNIPAEIPNMAQRAVMQCLSLDAWKIVARLPISAGESTVNRLLHHGWIEGQGEKQHTAIRLTRAGLDAMRMPIMRSTSQLVELGLKARK